MDELEFLKQPEVRAFIRDNEHADVQKLVLNPPKAFKEHIRLIADQIVSRKKLKYKLPKWVESQAILPPPVSTEQASSQETSQYKATILKGDQLIDLTGGTGVDTLALSQHFKAVTYVEPDKWLCRLFSFNQSILGPGNIEIHQSTAEKFLDQYTGNAVFFLDPSRRQEKQKVFLLEDCKPDILKIIPIMKVKGTEALIKLSPMLDIKEGIRKLENVTAVHIISVKNECKELLFHLDFESRIGNPQIICVNLTTDNQATFKFTFDQEQSAKAGYSEPHKFLYDPNASILKAGAFNLIATNQGLTKISSNTHLYTSPDPKDKFPGRCFEIVEADLKSGTIRKLFSQGRVNVITKNYPLNSESLKQKYKLKDGGDDYMIGFRDLTNTPRLFYCKRVY